MQVQIGDILVYKKNNIYQYRVARVNNFGHASEYYDVTSTLGHAMGRIKFSEVGTVYDILGSNASEEVEVEKLDLTNDREIIL